MELLVFFLIGVFIVGSLVVKAMKNQKNPLDQVKLDLELDYGDNLQHLVGKYQGRKVKIREISNSNQSPVTQFILYYKQSLQTDFVAQPQNNSSIKNGYKNVVTGDLTFDDEVSLLAKDVDSTKEFFKNNRLRAALENLFSKSKWRWPKINSHYVEVYLPRVCESSEDARNILRNLIYFTDLFESADLKQYGEKPKPPKLPSQRESESLQLNEDLFEQESDLITMTEEVAEIPVTQLPESAPEIKPVFESPEQEIAEPEIAIAEPKIVPTTAPTTGLNYQDVWDTLIGEGPSHYQANTQFKSFLEGESINWNAELESIGPSSSDRNFGVTASGWIAVFEPEDGDLKVKYRIGSDRKQSFEAENSNPVKLIEGSIIKYDSFTKTLYIDSNDEFENDRGYKSKIVSYADRLAEKEKTNSENLGAPT